MQPVRHNTVAYIESAPSADGRNKVGCIVLGRGEDDKKVHQWLTTAATTPGFIGFAVGPTVFREPLVEMRDKKSSRDAAVAEVARRYQALVDIFEEARAYKKKNKKKGRYYATRNDWTGKNGSQHGETTFEGGP